MLTKDFMVRQIKLTRQVKRQYCPCTFVQNILKKKELQLYCHLMLLYAMTCDMINLLIGEIFGV